MIPFHVPCSKCIECRLDYAREWAIRCVHESKMHEKNAFITLTYSDEHLPGPKLIYSDFQKFMKKLRKVQNDPMGVFVTGEYGEKNKRPHWHAIIFNWSPSDGVLDRRNERGDEIFTSHTLTKTWGKGRAEYGAVTFESAGYCARYAAKKLVHGKDGEHEFQPISKKSSKHAIGKKYLEKYWKDIFNQGVCRFRKGDTIVQCNIPRYYVKWLAKNQYDQFIRYVTETKIPKGVEAEARSIKILEEEWEVTNARRDRGDHTNCLTRSEIDHKIQQEKFKQLQNNLKL